MARAQHCFLLASIALICGSACTEEIEPTCNSGEACPTGKQCVNAVCELFDCDAAAASDPCPGLVNAGYECMSAGTVSQCLPNAFYCEETANWCQTGETCVDFQCIAPITCADDDDCPRAQSCQLNICQPEPCATAADCVSATEGDYCDTGTFTCQIPNTDCAASTAASKVYLETSPVLHSPRTIDFTDSANDIYREGGSSAALDYLYCAGKAAEEPFAFEVQFYDPEGVFPTNAGFGGVTGFAGLFDRLFIYLPDGSIEKPEGIVPPASASQGSFIVFVCLSGGDADAANSFAIAYEDYLIQSDAVCFDVGPITYVQ